MKVAMTIWEDSVSTVCDFSSRLMVFDVQEAEVKNRRMLRASGVKVIPCLRGSIEDVIAAYLVDGLSDARFLLPGFGPGAGCGGRGRRHRSGVSRLPDRVRGGDGAG